MAVYVTSDAHGHVRALDEVLEQVSLGADDVLYVLGDLIDRGPDPMGVVSLVRSLPQARVLLGNHELLMLEATASAGAPQDGAFDTSHLGVEGFTNWFNWMNNGGAATSEQLEQLSNDDYVEYLNWVESLPLHDVAVAGGRTYALVHAGINPQVVRRFLNITPDADFSDPETLRELLRAHTIDDLLWIREFLGIPTGLVGPDGKGAVVVAGHTPSPLLPRLASIEEDACITPEGQGMICEYGACARNGMVNDRIDIDCAAASGFGMGRVGVLRLDDHARFYASIEEGE